MASPSPHAPPAGFDVDLHRWAARAAESGWLDASRSAELAGLRATDATPLFDDAERPLTVGLFGGTGVGKSSLLNRIAGQPIARASAERPTSRGVSAYLHRSRTLDALPKDFPVERLHTAVHHEERWRDVLWIDMPDVDSVAEEHRAQVVQWLPHLDVVLYVASPERYRDDRGWQLLREHAAEHAWLFVMNQWDRADRRQLDDWRSQLHAAGFADPMLFRTVAGEAAGVASEDDFETLLNMLASLADRQLIDELARRGTLARLERLLDAATTLRQEALGEPDESSLLDPWRTFWEAGLAARAGALEARLPELVARSREAGDASLTEPVANALFDEATKASWQEALQRFAQEQQAQGRLPRGVARRYLMPAAELGLAALDDAANAVIGQALARPGTAWQRRLHAALATLTTLLPLAALGWAGWRVVAAFARGGDDPAAYLGTEFAITAALLVALAWALPWWLARRVRPSRAGALLRGLRGAVSAGQATVSSVVSESLERIEHERRALRTELDDALRTAGSRALPARAGPGQRDQAALPVVLSRLLSGATHVRAATHSDTDAAPVS